jgi:GntR family transcriptional regulator / MocR family aminotransferase
MPWAHAALGRGRRRTAACTRFSDQWTSDLRVVAAAAARGVAVEPLSPGYHEVAPVQGLAVGYRHIAAERVPEAVRRVAAVL